VLLQVAIQLQLAYNGRLIFQEDGARSGLERIDSQQQEILAWIRAHPAGQFAPQQSAPQLIVLGPQQGGPLQQIPLGGPPHQDIPLGGPPRQDIPLGGPPRQDIPLGPVPQQQIPLGAQPRQSIPLGNPAPQPQIPLTPMPPASGSLTPGFQRYGPCLKTGAPVWPPTSASGIGDVSGNVTARSRFGRRPPAALARGHGPHRASPGRLVDVSRSRCFFTQFSPFSLAPFML
jgi:hypothetical protein